MSKREGPGSPYILRLRKPRFEVFLRRVDQFCGWFGWFRPSLSDRTVSE